MKVEKKESPSRPSNMVGFSSPVAHMLSFKSDNPLLITIWQFIPSRSSSKPEKKADMFWLTNCQLAYCAYPNALKSEKPAALAAGSVLLKVLGESTGNAFASY